MMSIYERTKEIGVMKVLGCSLKNIKQLFLIEAAFIGFIGGVVGNVLSFLMSFIINILTGNGSAVGLDRNISYIPVWLIGVSMAFAVLVGMVAGYFQHSCNETEPARQYETISNEKCPNCDAKSQKRTSKIWKSLF